MLSRWRSRHLLHGLAQIPECLIMAPPASCTRHCQGRRADLIALPSGYLGCQLPLVKASRGKVDQFFGAEVLSSVINA